MASISAPSTLATFPYAHASSSRVPHVTLGCVHGSTRLAVAAVQGDGVWTYDIKTLRPTTSFTVPPSTVFASSPVSFVPPSEGERVTAVVVHTGEGVRDACSVWVWVGEEGEKKSISLEGGAHSVHCVRGGWPLVVVGVNGGLSAISPDLEVKVLLKAKTKAARVLSAGVIDRPLGAEARAVIIDEKGRAHVYTLEIEDRAELVADGVLSSTPLLAADVGADGTLTAIDNSNRVHSRSVRSIVDGTPGQPGIPLAHPCTPAAIISLPSSSRTLAALAVPTPTPSVALVAPSHDLPAVLATTTISTASTTSITHLAVLARHSDSHVVLGSVLSHPGAEGGRSAIHVSDVILPPGGVGLALLVGSAERTSSVFKVGSTTTSQPSAEKMLESVTAALNSGSPESIQRAEKVFTSWMEDEDKAVQSSGRRAIVSEPITRRALDAVFSAAKDNKGFASKIVQALVDRKAVNDNMWPDGVILGALVPASDWRNISRLVRTSPALPSRTSVALLAHALKEGKPGVSTTLEDILHGPSPDPAYRAELRRQIDSDGALRMLETYTLWAESHVQLGDGLDVWPDRPPKSSIPPFSAVIAHASALLDAQLPVLMSVPAAEELLLRLQAALGPAMAAQNDYRRIRAPVDAALRHARVLAAEARAREDRDASSGGKSRGSRKPTPRHRVESSAPGLSEEAVGKYRVEDIVF